MVDTMILKMVNHDQINAKDEVWFPGELTDNKKTKPKDRKKQENRNRQDRLYIPP